MTLKEAVAVAEKERGSKVVGAGDCGDRWIFCFEDDNGHLGGAPMFVFKSDGHGEIFFATDYIDSLESGLLSVKPVDLPE